MLLLSVNDCILSSASPGIEPGNFGLLVYMDREYETNTIYAFSHSYRLSSATRDKFIEAFIPSQPGDF